MEAKELRRILTQPHFMVPFIMLPLWMTGAALCEIMSHTVLGLVLLGVKAA